MERLGGKLKGFRLVGRKNGDDITNQNGAVRSNLGTRIQGQFWT